MRKVTVPIDMASEQKTILGFISTRQLIYILVGGSLIYSYIPIVFQLFSNIIVGIIACVISTLPTIAAVLILGFFKKHKLHLHFDKYLLIKFNYKKEIGIWRKGSEPRDWMVNR